MWDAGAIRRRGAPAGDDPRRPFATRCSMGRMRAAIEALRRRKGDVRSALERTDAALSRARAAMQKAETSILKTENLLKRDPVARKSR